MSGLHAGIKGTLDRSIATGDGRLQGITVYTAVSRSHGGIMSNTGIVLVPRTVMLISGQYIVWEGLRKTFEDTAGAFRIVVRPYRQVPHDSVLATNPADLFLLDLGTERDPIGLISKIREAAQNSKIVVMGGIGNMERLHHAIEYGVDGVILNVQPPTVVLAVIKALYPHAHNLPLRGRHEAECMDLRKSAQKQTVSERQPPVWIDALTLREQEVSRLVGQGLSNKEIACLLSISDSTVRHHLTNVFAKIGVPNRQNLLLRFR